MSGLQVRLHVGQGTHRGGLTVFPLWTDAPAVERDYVTGGRAPVDVMERAGSPAVDQLVVTNRADHPVLLLAGELLEGGWQHRALTHSTLLPPARPTVLEVVCVEAGRWHGDTQHRRMARRVPVAVLPRDGRADVQDEVWRRVRRYEEVAGPSATESLVERLDRVTPRVEELVRGLRPLAGQRGIVVGIAGRPAWLELFDSEDALAAHWTGLLHAAALDALGRPAARTPAALARRFAEGIDKAHLTRTEPAGLGRRLSGGGRVAVDALRWKHRTVHLSAVDVELQGV